jgi:hypothetical protein
MSLDSVAKFFEAVRTDEAVVERLRAASQNADLFAGLACELGRERGVAFEPSDVTAAFDALSAKPEGELSDHELSAVAGGTLTFFAYGGPLRPPPPPPTGMTGGGMNYNTAFCKF